MNGRRSIVSSPLSLPPPVDGCPGTSAAADRTGGRHVPALVLLAAGLLLAPGVRLAQGAPIYEVSLLGTLGGAASTARGINASGQAAGWALDPSQTPKAFVHDGSGITTPGSLPGAAESFAAAINDSGQVAGTSYVGGKSRATRWSGGNAVDIGTLGGEESSASAINDAGQIAGGSTTAVGQGHAYRYGPGGWVDIGREFGGAWSAAFGINESGQVAGYGEASPGVFRGFLWDEQRGITRLGTLGGASSYAMGINAAGWVIGHSSTAAGYMHAFLFRGGIMVDLGALGGGASYGYGINDAGDVVGYSWGAAGGRRAFLYSNGMMLDLNDFLPPGSSWELLEAYAINDAGQIVGTGRYQGRQVAFRLDPAGDYIATISNPEPGTLSLLLLGGLTFILLGLRRRRSR